MKHGIYSFSLKKSITYNKLMILFQSEYLYYNYYTSTFQGTLMDKIHHAFSCETTGALGL